jgi:hypothetical protein
LSISPRLRFIKRDAQAKDRPEKRVELTESNSDNAAANFDSNDDDADLFQVKRVYDPNEDKNTSDDEAKEFLAEKKTKTVSKTTLAKRLSKRNMTINKKIRFNDDEDANPIASDDDDQERGVSGINIEERREYLKKQDQIDKELFRQRVKSKHTVSFEFGFDFLRVSLVEIDWIF